MDSEHPVLKVKQSHDGPTVECPVKTSAAVQTDLLD